MNKLQKRQIKSNPGNYVDSILTLERAKLYLRESNSDQDDVITDLIYAGVAYMEAALDFAVDTMSLIYQYYDEFPSDGTLLIWHRFITDSNLVVEYWNGSAFTAIDSTNYRVDLSSVPPRVFLTSVGEWPDGSDDGKNVLRVGFKVDTTHSFYRDLRAAVMEYVAAKYENAEGTTELPSKIQSFIEINRMRS